MNMLRIMASLLAALPLLASAAVVISPDDGDTPLVITGWLGQGNEFTGHLRLTAEVDSESEAKATANVSFLVLASDLKSAAGDSTVGRQNVSLGGNSILQPGVPQDFLVTVTGISEPGTYNGELQLLLSGQPQDQATKVPLRVVARARPSLTPLKSAERLSLNLVNCQGRLSCGLAGRLLPGTALLDRWVLQYENTSPVQTKLVNSAVVVLGEKTGFQFSGEQFQVPTEEQVFAAREIGALPVTLNRATPARGDNRSAYRRCRLAESTGSANRALAGASQKGKKSPSKLKRH